MNILEIILDILIAWTQRSDNDNSIVGKSPLEKDISRFWDRVWLILLIAGAAAALYVWLISPRFSHLTAQQSSSIKTEMTK
jgi:hypothetical protein